MMHSHISSIESRRAKFAGNDLVRRTERLRAGRALARSALLRTLDDLEEFAAHSVYSIRSGSRLKLGWSADGGPSQASAVASNEIHRGIIIGKAVGANQIKAGVEEALFGIKLLSYVGGLSL